MYHRNILQDPLLKLVVNLLSRLLVHGLPSFFDEVGHIIQGIQFNLYGQREYYWLYNYHPGGVYMLNPRGGILSQPVPASQVMHTYCILRPGQVYGEKAFVAHSRQNATVIAQTGTEILVFPRHSIERLELQHPEVAAKLLHNIGFRRARKYA